MSLCLSALLTVLVAGSDIDESSPRVTHTVKVIRQIQNGVVAIFCQDPKSQQWGTGSGSLIDKDGFILTNDHVIHDFPGVAMLAGKEPVRYRTVARLPEKDLALIQIPPTNDMTPIRLGRSDDLMTGEPILVGGNPGGRGIVFTKGIVSSPQFLLGFPSALAMWRLSSDVRDRFIQIDAATNRGNSGGPLVNMLGHQVGVVSRKNYEAENVNFAIPIDLVREHFSRMLAVEVRRNFHLGVELDPLSEHAVVSAVAPGSPAESAGRQVNDRLLKLNGGPVVDAIDWQLELLQQNTGNEIRIVYQRDAQEAETTAHLRELSLPEPVAETGKQPGLHYHLYRGTFRKLPDFSSLEPVKSGVTQTLQTDQLAGDPLDEYALAFEGYLHFPKTGIYRVSLLSDDGSRLYLHDKVVIDNDGPHPAQELSYLTRMSEGWHPVRIEYFEASGESKLTLFIEGEGVARQETKPEGWRHDVEE